MPRSNRGMIRSKTTMGEITKFFINLMARKFSGLTLADFYRHGRDGKGPVEGIRDPSRKSKDDFT